MTTTRNRSSGMPSSWRAAARPPTRSTSRIDWRTGAPVTTARGSGDPGNATADAAALLAASRLARPGVRSYETTTIGITQPLRGEDRRHAGVAPDRHDHRRPGLRASTPTIDLVAANIFGTNARLRRSSRRWNPTTSRNVCGYGVSGSSRVSIPRCDPTYRIVSGVVSGRHQRVGDRQRREHVTRGSAAGDDGEAGAATERSRAPSRSTSRRPS